MNTPHTSIVRRLACLLTGCLMAATLYAQGSDMDQRKDSLLQQINQTEGVEKLKAHRQLTTHLFYSSALDTVFHYLALEEAEAIRQGNRMAASAVRGDYTSALYNHGRYTEIIDRTPADLAVIAEAQNWGVYFKTYSFFVESHYHAGQLEKAVAEATLCYERSKAIDAPEARAWPLLILARACVHSNRMEECYAYFHQCIEQAGNDEACLPVKLDACMDLGRTYYNHDRTDELGQLLPVWEAEIERANATGKINTAGYQANFYIVCTNYYTNTKEYDKLEMYCELLEQSTLAQALGVKLAVLAARYELATARGQYEQALSYAEQRNDIYVQMGTVEGQVFATRDKARTLVRLDRKDEAIAAFDLVLELKDSVTSLDVEKQLDELRTVYEVDKLTAEKERTRNYFLFALGGCGLLALALGIWLYFSRQITRKNRVLARQIRELTEQQEARERELLDKVSFLSADEITNGDAYKDDDCLEARKDRLCIAIRDLMLREKVYRDKNVTRDQVIERLGTNRMLFTDAFQYCFNMSFPEYINSLRLKEAIQLLEDPTILIDTISERTGFGTIRSFQRQFRSKYNMSPKDYREMLLADARA